VVSRSVGHLLVGWSVGWSVHNKGSQALEGFPPKGRVVTFTSFCPTLACTTPTHYNDDDDSLGFGLELKNYNFNTAIMKEWVYLYRGIFSLGLEDQVMIIRFLTFMTEQQWTSTKVH
jgi:hypothetical protein